MEISDLGILAQAEADGGYNARMAALQVKLVRSIPSPDGFQAELLLIEPNGDSHEVVCLCRFDGTTEITQDSEVPTVDYLNQRYTPQAVCFAARKATAGF